jgi:hypothetical protein
MSPDMVTFAQAQERAERWINADVPAYGTREIRVREFDLGFVVWSEAREGGPLSDDGLVRVVIARDSGEATLWPALPVGEVVRRYEEEYGPVPGDAVPDPPQRLDLEATSFFLSPPQWLQDAADRMGIPDRRSAAAAAPAPATAPQAGAGTAPDTAPGAVSPSAAPAAPAPSPAAGGIDYRRRGEATASPDAAPAAPAPSSGTSDDRRPGDTAPPHGAASQVPPEQRPAEPAGGGWAGKTVSDSGEGQSVAVPATVFAPPLSRADGAENASAAAADAPTELIPGASAPLRTMAAPAQRPVAPPQPGVPHTMGGSPYPPPGGPCVPLPPPATGPVPGPAPVPRPGPVPGPGAADIADLETAKAVRGSVPPPAGPPVRSPDAPPPPRPGTGTPPPPGTGDPHYAATMLAGPGAGPGAPRPGAGAGPAAPPPPPRPGTGTPPPPGAGDPHSAATMLAGPALPPPPPGTATPQGMAPPPPPPPPGTPQGTATPPPPAYGYPQGVAVPTVGPGYMAVLRYRGQDGSEQQLIRRSAPGTPHPEWQILHELRSLNVRPEQVLELHTELESCDLPGGYCARMIRETWPQVRISHNAPYGRDHASRRQGVQHLLTHQGELHQVAGAPARPQPQRVPMPDPHGVLRVPPVGLDVIGQELAGAFGPQGVFRFDQRAVSRAGVPDIVAQTLVWAGLPVDFGPFFWAHVQPGRPVPTLAELAAQRGVQPASDAGSYLVMGNDFGRQLCVQYGTAHIVAVPLEGGPGGVPAGPAQFVNSSLPEFARCMALLGRMWRLRIGLTPEQAGRWTVDFQAHLAAQDPAAIASPENWWSVLIEQMWDGLL